ncbi:MAG: Lrp/AsnC family transcriptional regulator [Rhodospirillales bacterium]|nr:Lrp/AsnC family transcriptional regulator [Rhodospirillales bacterium]
MKIALNQKDRQLLDVLQEEGRMSQIDLADRVALSPSQSGRRVKRLEEAGIIEGYTAVLDTAATGLSVVAFVMVSLERHGEREAAAFARAVEGRPNVLECWSISGDDDYMLRVVATDLRELSDWMMHDLLAIENVSNVHSIIALDKVKYTTKLPL